MKFRNLYSKTGTFTFKDQRIAFDGEFNVEDKELIEFLLKTSDFVCVQEKKEVASEIIINEEQEEPKDELAELKKYADELGLDYHPKIGLEKLQNKIDEHLNK